MLLYNNRCVKDKIPDIKTNTSFTTSSYNPVVHNSFGIVTVQFEISALEYTKWDSNFTKNNELKNELSNLFSIYSEENIKNLTILAKSK